MRVVGHAGIHVLVPGFPFLFGGTFIEGGSGSIIQTRERNFPSFLEGLSLRHHQAPPHSRRAQFPFLFGGTFIEALCTCRSRSPNHPHFPSFLEGLSLRHQAHASPTPRRRKFPFLFGRAFIEASFTATGTPGSPNFPSFLEGLSLRRKEGLGRIDHEHISLPFGKGFH